VTAAGGQGHLKGQIVRMAHCGYYGAFDIVIALGALENALRDLGHPVEHGAGMAAAQAVFAEAGSPAPVG
jgi:aspartate aminotransferase-like enzyme